MAQQTAVEWFVNELEKYGNPIVCEVLWEDFDSLVEQAKQMEMKKEFETKVYWFGRGVLAGRENRIEELQPKTYENK